MITQENYEAYLLLQQEGELSEKEEQELKDFLAQNPALAPQKDEYDPAIKAEYTINEPFTKMQSLLHPPVARLGFVKPLAIAASLALILCISILIFRNSKTSTPKIAKLTQKTTAQTPKPFLAQRQAKKPLTTTKIQATQTNFQTPKTQLQPTTSKELQQEIKEEKVQLPQPASKDNTPLIIQVNTLISYEEAPKDNQDTIFIYTNTLCTFSNKRPRNNIRFIVPESVTNLIAKL